MGFVGRIEEGELVVRDARDKVIGRGWDAAVARLPDKPTGEWKSLHIWREWPAEEAIAAGHPFAARSMLPVMLDLAAVYEDVVRYSSRTPS